MKSEKLKYTCSTCSGSIEVAKGEDVPECCSKPMSKFELEPCENNIHAEMARNDVIEDACDDGRGQR